MTVDDTTFPLLVDGIAAAKQAEREFHGDPFKPRSDAMPLSFAGHDPLSRGWLILLSLFPFVATWMA